MDEIIKKLYDSFNRGPAFLFIGQDYLKLETGEDPFLAEIIRKYGEKRAETPSYHDILSGEAQNSPSDSLAWMQGRCERFKPAKWLKVVSKYSWNGVYTSAIDLIWPDVFRSDWRAIQPIFDEKYNPSEPRNRHNLHCTFLYGRVDREDESEKVPLNQREWYKRKQIAIALARRLPELVTPLGVFIIEGYNSKTDWLSFEDLLSAVVDELNPGQAHIFSVTYDIAQNPYASQLIKENKLIIHQESLATFLVRGEEQGVLQLGLSTIEKKYGRKITLQNISLTIPASLWNRVSRSATILDDKFLIPPTELSPDARYREFRNFLSESGTRPIWSGYARKFAFKREFEFELRKEVDKKLEIKTLHDEPILISGQTGTGKSIALGRLANELRQESKFPILFIEGKTKIPLSSDIDAFCKWMKDVWEEVGKSGAPTTLIIWDANEVDSYYSHLKYLAGRGHRVVLVGSSYKQKARDHIKESLVKIEAPAKLNETEIDNFTSFLNSFEPTLGQQLQRFTSKQDDSFLVALYRLLPATRALIRSGIIKEYDRTEKQISKLARRKSEQLDSESSIYDTTLYFALAKAGYIKDKTILTDERDSVGGEEITETQKLLGLVMVPGSLGLRIPFELLLRTLGKDDSFHFTQLLSRFDIFHWYQDDVGNITIGPRHPLEAKLWTRTNIGGAKYEVDYARKLLIELKDDTSYNNIEVQFAVDLVRNMGPHNQENSLRYSLFYRDISETLGDLREKRSIKNPRLMLQEVTLLREYVIQKSQEGNPPSDTDEIFDDAETVLNEAIELLGQEPKTKGIYLGELASLHGTRFLHSLKFAANSEQQIKLFEAARNAALQAWSIDTENYIPLDVLCWTMREFLDLNNIPVKQRLEAEADILHAFELAESEEYGAFQEERLHERRYQIGKVLGREELTDDAFEELKAMGSSAGYYLRAHSMVSDIPFNEELASEQQETCSKAVGYLENNREIIKKDGRSLYLLLRLWWMAIAGRPLFFGERQTVPFSEKDWLYCFRILESLINSGDQIYSTTKFIYLQGLVTFQIGDIHESFKIFKHLERESDYKTGRRRIIRSYIASLPSGKPKKFIGEVKWVNEDKTKGGIFVPEIREVVNFFPRDFNRPDIKRGESLGEFHIAFNFLGPSADPIRYLRTYRGR